MCVCKHVGGCGCYDNRLEWLEMKQMYKQLQKEQMKKLKQGNKSEETGVGGANPQKRFVSNCLVKVSISESIAVSKEQLKVCLCCRLTVCLSVHPSVRLSVCLLIFCASITSEALFKVWFCGVCGRC